MGFDRGWLFAIFLALLAILAFTETVNTQRSVEEMPIKNAFPKSPISTIESLVRFAEQEAVTETPPAKVNKILGSDSASIDQLLQGWRSEPSQVSSEQSNYYDSNESVKLIVVFSPSGIAIGVSVVNLYGIPITKRRMRQLLTLIGDQNPQVVRYEGEIVEFHVGDMGDD